MKLLLMLLWLLLLLLFLTVTRPTYSRVAIELTDDAFAKAKNVVKEEIAAFSTKRSPPLSSHNTTKENPLLPPHPPSSSSTGTLIQRLRVERS